MSAFISSIASVSSNEDLAGAMWVGKTQTHLLSLLKELKLDTYPQYCTGAHKAILDESGKVHTYESSLSHSHSLHKPTIDCFAEDDFPGSIRAGIDAWNLLRKLEKESKNIDVKAIRSRNYLQTS